MKLEVTNVDVALLPGTGDEEDDVLQFKDATAYFVKGYKMNQRFLLGMWDGKKQLVKKARKRRGQEFSEWRLPIGLLDDAIAYFGDVEVIDSRSSVGSTLPIVFDPDVVSSLRDYQQEAVEAFLEDRGITTGMGLLRLPTRSGKTVIAAGIIEQLGVRTLFIVQSHLLLRQTVDFFRAALKLSTRKGKLVRSWESRLIGQYGGGTLEPGWITVASVQSLVHHWKTKTVQKLLRDTDLVVFDECFAAGTPIRIPGGTKPIESVEPGDVVLTYDEGTGLFTEEVVRWPLTSNVSTKAMRVTISGETFVVTAGHPWHTRRGWVPSASLTRSDHVRLAPSRGQGGKTEGGKTEWGRVEGLERVRSARIVYNFEVERTHTYLVGEIGAVVHNCHHLEGEVWRKAMLKSDARYKLGLSATIDADHVKEESDGSIWLIAATGSVLYSLQPSQLIEAGWLCRPRVTFVTAPEPEFEIDDRASWQTVYRERIVENDERNELIAMIAKRHVIAGDRVLVTLTQIKHTKRVAKAMKEAGLSVAEIIGKTTAKKRVELTEGFRSGALDVMIGTVFGEGVDLPWLDVVIVADAGKSTTVTLQRLRNLTPYNAKTGKARREPMEEAVVVPVYDFADMGSKILRRHSRARLKTYVEHDAFEIVWERE